MRKTQNDFTGIKQKKVTEYHLIQLAPFDGMSVVRRRRHNAAFNGLAYNMKKIFKHNLEWF